MDQSVQQPSSPAPTSTPSPVTPTATQPENNSSNKKLLIIVILVVVLVIGGVLAWQMMTRKSSSLYQGASAVPSATPAVSSPAPTTGAVKSGDAQLDAESSAIDKSMSQLEGDVQNVDKGLQDQPVNLN
jgi:hypothetical protein